MIVYAVVLFYKKHEVILMSIMEKAKELGQEIVESTEYKKLKSAENDMHNDKEAESLLSDFQAKQKQVQMMQTNGKIVSQQLQQKIQSIQSKMQENPKIKSFMKAQENFNEVMKTINQTISHQLQNS